MPKKKTEPKLKVAALLLPTRRDAEQALAQVKCAVLDRERIAAELERKKDALDEEYAPRLEESTRIIEQNGASLLRWAMNNRATEFGDKQSIETLCGFLKFHKGQPQLKLLLKSWDRVLERIKSFGLEPLYIRTNEEVNKEALIADRNSKLLARAKQINITDLGVKVVQEESFTIEIKRQDVPEPQIIVEESIKTEVKAA